MFQSELLGSNNIEVQLKSFISTRYAHKKCQFLPFHVNDQYLREPKFYNSLIH